MTLKNNRAPLWCCSKLCVSFHSHQSIPIGVTVWKHPILVKICDFFVPCDRQIWWMTLKNKSTSSMLLQALCIILQPSVNSDWSYSLETPNSCQNRCFFCPVWPWNLSDDLKNNRAPLICHIKLCASLHWPALCAGLLCCNFFDMLTPVPFYHFFSSLILLFIYV